MRKKIIPILMSLLSLIFAVSCNLSGDLVPTYDVFFDNQGLGISLGSLKVEENMCIKKPEDPFETGYSFGGWYSEPECVNKWDFNTRITSNTTLYAKWSANSYGITYKDGGNLTFSGVHGTGVPTTHTYGAATTLSDATKTGYTFGGWYDNKDCTGDAITILGETVYSSDITLYAKWIAKQTIITFDKQDGSGGSDSVTADYGSKMPTTGITAPTRTGYAFTGYYDSTSGGNKYYDRNMASVKTWDRVDETIVLYAQWSVLGAVGQAGGIIFYDCDADNDSGNADGLISTECGWRYLEAAPTDVSADGAIYGFYRPPYSWPAYVNDSTEFYEEGTSDENDGKCTGTALGTGKANTLKLVDKMGDNAYYDRIEPKQMETYAAKAASEYSFGGYDDWFLPSKKELECMLMFLGSNNLGGIKKDWSYWSSSESGNYPGYAFYCRYQSYKSSVKTEYDEVGYVLCVRCIRAY